MQALSSSQWTHFHQISERGHCCRGNTARFGRTKAGLPVSFEACKSVRTITRARCAHNYYQHALTTHSQSALLIPHLIRCA